MKKILSLFVSVSLLIACNSEKADTKTDLEFANLKGPVQSVDKTIHDAGAQCVCPAATKAECNKSVVTYGKDGMITESTDIDDDGNIQLVSKYVYNRKGVCSEVSKYKGETLVGKDITEFENGKPSGIKVINEKGEEYKSFRYKWTEDLITEQSTLTAEGAKSTLKNEFENGQLVKQTELDGSGNVITTSHFSRNENNDVTEYLIKIAKDNSEFRFTFTYEYDSFGNWTKQTQFYEGKIVNVVLRNITYYEEAAAQAKL